METNRKTKLENIENEYFYLDLISDKKIHLLALFYAS